MAIPGNPSVTDIIMQGMKEGGQYTIVSGSSAFLEFKNYQFESVKTEIWNACRTDRMLETEVCVVAQVGASQVSLPSDYDSEVDVVVFDADETYRGTAQAGSASSVTLASTFSAHPDNVIGRFVFTVGGLGSGQVRQIIGYDDTSKVATVSSNFTTFPDTTTQYVIGVTQARLRRKDLHRVSNTGRPVYYSITGSTLQVWPSGDKIYPLILVYRPNLTRLDDGGDLFVKHLRERRHLWVQGVKVKTMARYDDERYSEEKGIWERMLMQYAAQNVVYTQMEINR